MSDLSNQLVTIAMQLHGVLDRYIAVHDQLFKSSLRRIIPLPLIFKAIDFKQLNSESGQLVLQLEGHKNHLNELAQQAGPSEFGNTLIEFCSALIETISLLREITSKLDFRSRNMGNYTASEHKELVDAYHESVERYRSVGVKLNRYF